MKISLTSKLVSLGISVLLVFFFVISSHSSEKNTEFVYLTGGDLLDVTQGIIIPNSLIIIKGDTIVYAGPNKPFENMPDKTVIDCLGKTLLPGLFDAHIHLGGSSTLGYIPLADQRKLSAFLYSGVTSVFDLGAIQDWIFSLRDAERRDKILSPRIFAVGPLFTSPNGHGTEYGVPMSLTPTTEKEAQEAVRKLIPAQPDHIKIIYEKGSKRFTSLSYELMEAIIDEAHKNNFTVVTHIISFEQAKDAIKAGTDGLAYMVTDQEVSEEFLDEMKQKNVFCIPTLAVFESFSGGMQTIPANINESLLRQGISQEIIADLQKKQEMPGIKDHIKAWNNTLDFAKTNIKKMSDKGIKLALGTDAGNPAVFFGPSVHREMELMVEAGISPADVIKSATINAAEILGQGDKLRSISEGKLADILVIEGNPIENIRDTQNIAMVIKNGQILDREELAQKINPPEESSTKSKATTKIQKKEVAASSPVIDSSVAQKINEAKKLMKKGLDTWDPGPMKKARDELLGLLVKEKQESLYPFYYIALCDYRLTNYYFTSTEMAKAEAFIKESQKYLEKAMEMAPTFGELDALYASMLGFEIALHNEKAMSLGFQIFQHFGEALEKNPNNPRIHLLKGMSDLFTPEEYGGGPDAAIKTLNKSVELFEKEESEDSIKPSWGKDEAYTFLGMAHNQKGESDKAEGLFKKALETNPEFGLAIEELRKIEK